MNYLSNLRESLRAKNGRCWAAGVPGRRSPGRPGHPSALTSAPASHLRPTAKALRRSLSQNSPSSRWKPASAARAPERCRAGERGQTTTFSAAGRRDAPHDRASALPNSQRAAALRNCVCRRISLPAKRSPESSRSDLPDPPPRFGSRGSRHRRPPAAQYRKEDRRASFGIPSRALSLVLGLQLARHAADHLALMASAVTAVELGVAAAAKRELYRAYCDADVHKLLRRGGARRCAP